MLRSAAAVAFATALAAALPATPAAAEQTAAPAAALPAISVALATRAFVRDRVIASGTVAPVERVSVSPRVEGQPIERLLADLGDRVEEGQVLAELSESMLFWQKNQLMASRAAALAAVAQARASLVEARASADEAIRVRDRQAELLARGVGAQAAADQSRANAIAAEARVAVATEALAAAEAQVAVIDAQIATADLSLSRTKVLAPVAGEIVERNAMVGAIASAGAQPMFVIIRDGALELRADVAEQDVLRLAPGQKAMLRIVGLADPVPATVRLVEPAVDSQTRLGRVRLAIDDPSRVRPGLFAQAEIIVAERETLTVPITAVSSDGGAASVFRVSAEGVVERVSVKTGIRDRGLVEIAGGIAEGDTIVARAGAFVRPGDRIKPVLASN